MGDKLIHTPELPELLKEGENGGKEKIVENLSVGILKSCEIEVTSIAKELKDFTDRQNELIEKLGVFNFQSKSNPVYGQLQDTMEKLNVEMDRLSTLRQQMVIVQERSQKLKARAEKLRTRAEDKERRDEELVAQLVSDEDAKDLPAMGLLDLS